MTNIINIKVKSQDNHQHHKHQGKNQDSDQHYKHKGKKSGQ